jgi:hypothetical protein
MRSMLVPIVTILSISAALPQTSALGFPPDTVDAQRLVVFEDFMRPT